MVRAALSLAGAVLCACAEHSTLPALELEGARSFLLVGTEPAGSPHAVPGAPVVEGRVATVLHAVDVATGDAPPAIFHGASTSLLALAFKCDCNEIGTGCGALSIGAEGTAGPPLPAAWAMKSLGPEDESWQAPSAVPPAIGQTLPRIRARSASACEARGVSLEPAATLPLSPAVGGEIPLVAVPVGDDVYFATSRGALHRLDSADRLHPHQIPSVNAILAAAPAGPGELWLMSANGVLLRGAPDAAPQIYPGRAVLGPLRYAALAGPPNEDASEVWMATDDRRLQRYDGQGWVEVMSRPPADWVLDPEEPSGTFPFIPSVIWLGPGRIVTHGVSPVSPSVVVFVEGGVTREVRLPGGFVPTALAAHPTLGVLVASSDGFVYRAEGDQAELRVSPKIGNPPILTLDPEGRGVIFSSLGFIGASHPDTTDCAGLRLDALPVRAAVRANGEVVLGLLRFGGPRLDSARPEIVVLRRARSFADCSL